MVDLDATAEYLVKYINEQYNPENVDFNLLSTIRYDPALSKTPPTSIETVTKDNFYLFDEHYHRLDFTLKYFQIHLSAYLAPEEEKFGYKVTEKFLLKCLVQSLKDANDSNIYLKPLKIRLLVSRKGELNIELYDTLPRPDLLDGLSDVPEGPVWDVRIDTEKTLISPFTSYKTTHRPIYTNARARRIPGLNPGLEEVILINTQGQVMEGSITNIAIRRKSDNSWITPALSSGCLCGVARNFLLRQRLIVEDQIKLSQLEIGSEVLLFNGVMGVVRGRIVV